MREEQKAMAFSKQMTENLEHFKQILQTDKNFDVVYLSLIHIFYIRTG